MSTDELDYFLSEGEVCALIRLSRSSVYRMEQAHEFPKRMRIGGVIRWSSREVAEWQRKVRAEQRIKLPPLPASRVSKKLLAARAQAPRTPRRVKPLRFAS
jgi:predicted DNA-binding transcriptional regulator AlpA